LRTFCIIRVLGEQAFFGLNEVGTFADSDRRGWRERKSKLFLEAIRECKARNETFRTVKSHYCRKITKQQYLDPHLSVSKTHYFYTQKFTEGIERRMSRIACRSISSGTIYRF
jgi:hypothetical protein